MALLNLSLVTDTLKTLLEQSFKTSPAWSAGLSPTISPLPPDKLNGDAVGIYMYHITEDSHYKNLLPKGADIPPVRYVPMGLNLYYQLTAHSATDDTYQEQKMMGIAIKALHDYPVIDDSTKIADVKIFPALLQGNKNRLRIVLQPVIHNEAISYWTAGSSPLRLATYYQVSVVLLEPEETQSLAGRVLAYGVQTFAGGSPRLDGSKNVLSFMIPGGTATRRIEVKPAQVPPAKSVTSTDTEDSTVTFYGTGLAGDRTILFLKNRRWEEPVEIDAAWKVHTAPSKVSAIVQKNTSGENIIPGIYSAVVKVVSRRTMSDGSSRDLEYSSNDTPFMISPRIDKIEPAAPSDNKTVTGYIFKDSDIPDKAVQVYIGEAKLKEKDSGVLNAGEFKINSPSKLELRIPQGLESDKYYPVRILVNGAESPPNWIKTP